MLPPSAEELLELMAVPSLKRIYVLGCLARRVTFYSQQCRAFNLVWALFENGELEAGATVGVVGGGLAGITVAAALVLKGCKVTLMERQDKVLHLQRLNNTRAVYPYIYNWPAEGATRSETDLPCLNWHAALAGDVVDQLLDQWHRFASHPLLSVELGFAVDSVFMHGTRPRVSGNHLGATGGWTSKEFDSLILSVGFGKERGVGGTKSYWQIDHHHQTDLGHSGVKRVLVSGCGDGGLIDALRFRLDEFHHSLILDQLLSGAEVERLAPQLLRIDETVREKSAGDMSISLYDEYQGLELPQGLLSRFKQRLRKDTEVTLNSGSHSPFSLDASILNRFCIFILLKINGLHYRQGRLLTDSVERTKSGYNVSIVNTAGGTETFAFHEVIVRHGPEPVLDGLINAADRHSLKRLSYTESDATMCPCWSRDFYPTGPLCSRPSPELRFGKVFAASVSATGAMSQILADSPRGHAQRSEYSGDVEATSLAAEFKESTTSTAENETAKQYTERIYQLLRVLELSKAEEESKAATAWVAAKSDRVETSVLRRLYGALARELVSRSARNSETPSLATELKERARNFLDLAKKLT